MKNLLKKVKKFFRAVWLDLFYINGKPIGFFAGMLLVFLDVFLLVNIVRGIDDSLVKAPPPYVKYPYECVRIFSSELTYNSIESLYVDRNSRAAKICKDLYALVEEIKDNPVFAGNLETYRYLTREISKLQRRLPQRLQMYDNALLEKMAKEDTGRLSSEKRKFYETISKIKDYKARLKRLTSVDKIPIVENKLIPFVKKNREAFEKERSRYIFLYPFIYLFYMMKFLLPIFAISAFVFFKTKNSTKPKMQTLHLLSSHLFLVAAVPATIYIFGLIYDIIPKKFLSLVLEKLYQWGVVYLGYYFVVFGGLLLFGLFLYKYLKKAPLLERARRIKEIRSRKKNALVNGICFYCGSKVRCYNDKSCKHCQYCGKRLMENCDNCKEPIPIIAKFCRYCGNKNV